MLIPRKYKPFGRQHQVVLSLPSKQATFINKYIKRYNDKRHDIEYTIEDFLATFVDEFYNAESVKTKEEKEADWAKYQEILAEQQRAGQIEEIERQQAELERQKQELLGLPELAED